MTGHEPLDVRIVSWVLPLGILATLIAAVRLHFGSGSVQRVGVNAAVTLALAAWFTARIAAKNRDWLRDQDSPEARQIMRRHAAFALGSLVLAVTIVVKVIV